MKRIIIDLEDDYADGLSLTTIGITTEVKVATGCFNNLANNTHIIMQEAPDHSIEWLQHID